MLWIALLKTYDLTVRTATPQMAHLKVSDVEEEHAKDGLHVGPKGLRDFVCACESNHTTQAWRKSPTSNCVQRIPTS